MRNTIITEIDNALKQISKVNGYNTDFDRFLYWASTPTEYDYNYLIYRDTSEEYQKHNTYYKAKLNLEIVAIVIETDTPASILGNLAIADLIDAIKKMSLEDLIINLARSHKYVETKGKTACQIELEIDAIYRISPVKVKLINAESHAK